MKLACLPGQIVEFIHELDSTIEQKEYYDTSYEVKVGEIELDGLSDKSILDLQCKHIKEQT